MPTSRLLPASGLALLILVSQACAKPEEQAAPVVTPSFSLNRDRAALGSPIETTLRFVIASTAPPFAEDYRVLVHFLDVDDELMWADDHEPPVPTTQWKPGQTVEYTRTTFVPIYPYIGETSVWVGLYSQKDQRRLALVGEDSGQRSYRVGRLQLLPQSENVFLMFKDGWHRAEVAQDNAAVEWQWTKKDATIAFRNPRRDCLFYLQLDGRAELFSDPQKVVIRAGDATVDSFAVTSNEEMIRKIPLSVAQLGTADMVDLRISVDKTFVPALLPAGGKADNRELGIRVFHAFVEPK